MRSATILPAIILTLSACSEYEIEPQQTTPGPPLTTKETPQPQLKISPESIGFGELALGLTQTAIVQLSNIGDAPLDLWDFTLADANGPFNLTATQDALLDPNESTSLIISYTPTDAFNSTGTLQFSTNDPERPTPTVPITGNMLAPQITITPETHDFGTLSVGDLQQLAVEVGNAGSITLEINDALFASSSQSELFVSDWGDLVTGTTTIEPGATAIVTVSYLPNDDFGPDESNIRLLSNDPVNPDVIASQFGDAIITSTDYDISVIVTADDRVELFIDGTPQTLPNGEDWQNADIIETTLSSGTHIIAVHGVDVANVISGVLVAVYVDGIAETLSGDGQWLSTGTAPSSDWIQTLFDDSSWSIAPLCSDSSTWGTYWNADLYKAGLQWIWSRDCRDLGEGWFRYKLVLP